MGAGGIFKRYDLQFMHHNLLILSDTILQICKLLNYFKLSFQ